MRALFLILLLLPAVTLAEEVSRAIALVSPLDKSGVTGIIRFESSNSGMLLLGEFKGLKPSSAHGMHIHEYGDCSAVDGSSAGGHYKKPETKHGGPGTPMRHLGDLGNLTSNSEGVANYKLELKGLSVGDVLGRAVVVHAGEDDLKSDPSGNSGGRVACGVIGLTK